MYWVVFSAIVLLILGLALSAVFLFRLVWKTNHSRIRRIAENLSVSIFSFLVVLLLLELCFKLFFAQTDGLVMTLAYKNWTDRYWQVNSLGYRDREWTPEMLKGRTKIMVLGDSFVAGVGIDRVEDRFSDVLGQALGDDYAVMNVGMPGANTQQEIQNALAYPYPPDIVILVFLTNDIEGTAADLGYPRPPVRATVPGVLEPLVSESYLLNFLYWRLYRLGIAEWVTEYRAWLVNSYDNPQIWQAYQQQLLQVHQHLEATNRQLVVVVFPYFPAAEENRPMTSQVVNLFAEQGVPVLDVSEMIEGMDLSQITVNRFDPHANEFLNHLVGDRLYRMVLDCQQTSTRSDQ